MPAIGRARLAVMMARAVATMLLWAICLIGAIWLFSTSSGWATLVGVVLLLVASMYCYSAQNVYCRWFDDFAGGTLSRQLLPAAIGWVVVTIACWCLVVASSHDSRLAVGISAAFIVTGLFPLVHVVHVDTGAPKPQPSSTDDVRRPPAEPWSRAVAWGLNIVIVAMSILPFAWLLGVPWTYAVAIGVGWLLGIALARFARWRVARSGKAAIAGGLAAATALVAVRIVPTDQWWLLVAAFTVFLLGAKVASLSVIAVLDRRRDTSMQLPPIAPAPAESSAEPAESSTEPAESATESSTGSAERVVRAVAPEVDERWPVIGSAIVAAAFAAAVVAWLWLKPALGAASWAVVILAAAGLMMLGAIFITRGEGFAVVAVVGLTLVWVVADRDLAAPAWKVDDGAKRIVVLGDSYSSGEGAAGFLPDTNNQGGNTCRRAPTAYGFLIAEHFGRRLTTFACSGAVADKIANSGQIGASDTSGPRPEDTVDDDRLRHVDGNGVLAGRRPQLDNIDDTVASTDVDLVVMSIGGNDALFSKIGQACAMPGTCSAIEAAVNENLLNVRSSVTDALVAVGTKFDNAVIVLIAYPAVLGTTAESIEINAESDPEAGTASPDDAATEATAPTPARAGSSDVDAAEDADLPSGAPLDRDEITFLRTFLAALNRQLATSVEDANETLERRRPAVHSRVVWVGETEAAFDVDEAVVDGTSLPAPMNMVRLVPTDGETVFDRVHPPHWIHNTFHPTAEGHRRIACVLERVLPAIEELATLRPEPDGDDCYGVATPPATATTGRSDDRGGGDQSAANVPLTRKEYEAVVSDSRTRALTTSVRDVVWLEGALLMAIGWLAAVVCRFGWRPTG
jgi:lysophospholipase L1-like esterase